ncbi:DMT family transporter [Aeromonas caviae]|uniref:DMT family transporter n=1 Tax=Aeromonas caviae TaxID=648 RepID=UPI0038D18B51
MIPPLVDRGPGRPALGQTLGQTLGTLAAFAAGLLLALMIAQNGALSRATDPWLASWLAHGVGSLVAGLLWWLSPRPPTPEAAPPWAWLGGLPGALTVVLAALCLNSPLGMAGTLALLLLGQLLFGALCDGLGWLGLARRRPSGKDALAALLVMACALLIVTGQLAGGALLDALAGRLAASDLLGILLVLAGAALQRWQGGKSRSRG